MTTAEVLAEQLDGSRDWTIKLIADLEGDQWTFQPAEGVQHALWICGHLAVAEHLLVLTRSLGRGEPDAEFAKHFPVGAPVRSGRDDDHPSPQVVRARMDGTHAQVLEAIRSMSEEQLAARCYGKDGTTHPHYTTNRGAIAHCSRHEGFHAGQIAMLRRLMGKSFLR